MASISNNNSRKRKMRLRELMDSGVELVNLVDKQSPKKTLDAVQNITLECNDLMTEACKEARFDNATEVVLDAHVLLNNHSLVKTILHKDSEFAQYVYISAITKLIKDQDESENWGNLFNKIYSCAHTARLKKSMLGAVIEEPEEQPRSVKQRQQRKPIEAEKQLNTVSKLDRADKGAEILNTILQLIMNYFKQNNNEPIPYFKLIIDPNNINKSIMNGFQVAFLVRDNKISLETGKNSHPYIGMVSSEKKKNEHNLEEKQTIMRLHPTLLNEMKEYYNITEAMINIQ